MTLPDPPILVITDRRQCADTMEDRAVALFRGGCRWLSLREKDLEPEARLALLARLTEIARPFGAAIGVHGDVAAAAARGTALHLPANCDGAEVRRIVGAETLIGKSCHSAAEVATAEAEGVDYATLSPLFATGSKPGYMPTLRMDDIRTITGERSIPVLALGGVGLETIARLSGSGIGGIAIMGEAMRQPDPEHWFPRLAEAWRRLG